MQQFQFYSQVGKYLKLEEFKIFQDKKNILKRKEKIQQLQHYDQNQNYLQFGAAF